MNKIGLSTLGAVIVMGLVKDLTKSGSSNELVEIENFLKEHFAIPSKKSIPKTYVKNELERFTVLPPELRTEQQEYVISMLKEYMKIKNIM